MVARVELHNMEQDTDEGVRSFGARIKSQASVCKHIISCPSCNHDVIVRGISDCEIQLDILSDHNMFLNCIIRS